MTASLSPTDGSFAADPLDAALRDLRSRYAEQRPRSRAAQLEAEKWVPGALSHASRSVVPFPFRAAEAFGAMILDVDGHTYIDLSGEYTAGVLGHNPPAVAEAVEGVLRRGWALGARLEDELVVARLLCQRFPAMERVRLVNSGTEANLLALGIAAGFTGRTQVVAARGACHGSLFTFADGQGALNVPHPVTLVRYNDLRDAKGALASEDVSCVIVEPWHGAGGRVIGEASFLEGLREECSRRGTLLVFDEVMTSRLAPGGLQRTLGIEPDLTTVGNHLAGGLSFGAVGGRAVVLDVLDATGRFETRHPGRVNNAFSMAAARAVLEAALPSVDASRLNCEGDRMRRILEGELWHLDIGLAISGRGSMMQFRADDPRRVEWLFHTLLARGVYMRPTGMIALSAALTDGMRERAIEAAVASLIELHGLL